MLRKLISAALLGCFLQGIPGPAFYQALAQMEPVNATKSFVAPRTNITALPKFEYLKKYNFSDLTLPIKTLAENLKPQFNALQKTPASDANAHATVKKMEEILITYSYQPNDIAVSVIPPSTPKQSRIKIITERILRRLPKLPDQISSWPGKPGDKIRINGRTYTLDHKIGEGNSAVIYRVEGKNLILKFIHPEFRNLRDYGDEVEALQAMAHTDIPHARLRNYSSDKSILIKDYIPGPTKEELLKKGPLNQDQIDNLAELEARFIRIGYSAHLHSSNLVWDVTKNQWVVIDAGGFKMVPKIKAIITR